MNVGLYLVVYIIPFFAVAAIQFLCCRYVKNKYLRHTGLIVGVGGLVMAVIAFFSDPGFIAGGNVVVAMLFLYLAVSSFAGYGAGWGIYRLYSRKKG